MGHPNSFLKMFYNLYFKRLFNLLNWQPEAHLTHPQFTAGRRSLGFNHLRRAVQRVRRWEPARERGCVMCARTRLPACLSAVCASILRVWHGIVAKWTSICTEGLLTGGVEYLSNTNGVKFFHKCSTAIVWYILLQWSKFRDYLSPSDIITRFKLHWEKEMLSHAWSTDATKCHLWPSDDRLVLQKEIGAMLQFMRGIWHSHVITRTGFRSPVFLILCQLGFWLNIRNPRPSNPTLSEILHHLHQFPRLLTKIPSLKVSLTLNWSPQTA